MLASTSIFYYNSMAVNARSSEPKRENQIARYQAVTAGGNQRKQATQPEGIASNHVIVFESQVKASVSACKVMLYAT